MEKMTSEQLVAHIDEVIKNYEGDSGDLSNAIGALMIGRLYGWRVMRIINSSPSYTKHQRILGLEFKKVLPEVTDLSEKSRGYRIAKRLNNFWQVVRGQATIDAKDKKTFA